jgi:hypothetical protein
MSFSTYRRQLSGAVDRLTHLLWQQEQDALETEIAGGQTADRAAVRFRFGKSAQNLGFATCSKAVLWLVRAASALMFN